MSYVRLATGYRPGGSNAGVVGAPATFDSDKLINYEVGIKSQLFDHRLLVNSDVFYIDWKNIQIAQNTPANLGYTGNAGAAKSKGFELVTQYSLTPQLRIGGNLLYDDATLSVNAPAAGGAAGDPLPLSAKWNASITADWSHSLGDDKKVSGMRCGVTLVTGTLISPGARTIFTSRLTTHSTSLSASPRANTPSACTRVI